MPRVNREIVRPSRMKLLVRRQRRNLRLAAWALGGFALVLVGMTVAHSAQSGGAVAGLEQRFGKAIDLRVRAIEVSGRENTPQAKLMDALSVHVGDRILGFSIEKARADIERLPWVQHVAVERRLPDTIFVDVTERRPFAIWQNQGKFQLVDRGGEVVADEDVAAFQDLPLVVGLGAPAHAADMLDALAAAPDIKARVDAIVRVGERRWNLHLKNRVVVMLPEGHEAAALTRLSALQAQQQLLDRPLLFVDMRLGDRLAVRTRPPADAKPADAKPGDAGGNDAKPGEPRPADAKPPTPPNRRAT